MADWRARTGTRTLQAAWSLLGLLVLVVVVLFRPRVPPATDLAVGAAAWLLGLALLGWRERRAWSRLVRHSTFERQRAGTTDLQRTRKGHTVTVTTAVPGLLSQAHTVVATSVDGVDATVRIDLEHVGSDGTDEGVTTGNDALDDTWIVRGSRRNVKLLLSTDVQAALMDVTVPASVRVTANRVAVEVPFTRLEPDELATLAELAATVAERLERLGRGGASPTA